MENSLVLTQRKVGDKSNEITAIPRLLAAPEPSGRVRTSVANVPATLVRTISSATALPSICSNYSESEIRCVCPGFWIEASTQAALHPVPYMRYRLPNEP